MRVVCTRGWMFQRTDTRVRPRLMYVFWDAANKRMFSCLYCRRSNLCDRPVDCHPDFHRRFYTYTRFANEVTKGPVVSFDRFPSLSAPDRLTLQIRIRVQCSLRNTTTRENHKHPLDGFLWSEKNSVTEERTNRRYLKLVAPIRSRRIASGEKQGVIPATQFFFFLHLIYLSPSTHLPSTLLFFLFFLSFFFSLFLRRDPSSSCSTPFGDPFLLRFPSPSPLPPRSFVRPAHQNPRFLRAFLSSTEPSYQVPLSTHPAAACPRFSRVLPRSSVFIFVLSQFRLDTLALTGQWVSGKHLLRFLLPSYTILATGYWRAGGACTLTSLHRPLSAFLFYFYAFAAPGPSPGNSPYKSEK